MDKEREKLAHNLLLNQPLGLFTNTEKKIAQAIMDAQKMQQESFDGEEYKKDISDCLLETCKKHGLSDNMWALLNLAMHWWNDIQCWADDVMAGKNILEECCRKPMSDDDVIALTDKGREHNQSEYTEVDLHIPICDTILKLTADGQLEVKTVLLNLCDTCESHRADCIGKPKLDAANGGDNVIECTTYKKRE